MAQLTEKEYVQFPQILNPRHLKERTQFPGYQKLIMLDRYSLRDLSNSTVKEGDTVVCTVKPDAKYPTQGYGKVKSVDGERLVVSVQFPEYIDGVDLENFEVAKNDIIKPLELYWEQIAHRVAKGVASVEKSLRLRKYWFKKFNWMLKNLYAIPGGRILYGAGSGNNVTLFNCFVLPHVEDSRSGILSKHITNATEIMSRGGGVGSNISTLRPANTFVAGVNGTSSGAISWGNYLAQLTHLISQGGSRRGAQMIGMKDWHPDVISFILCKIQNPNVLAKISNEVKHPMIKAAAEYFLVRDHNGNPVGVRDDNFMTGANISVLISDDFMRAVENGDNWTFRFPDLDNMTSEQKAYYDKEWSNIGDVRKWEAQGLPVKEYATIEAADMWHLINMAARYSAEPGMIFMDTCNNMSNSHYYSDLVVTNPCGEQPLPPNAVCNLIAMNLAKVFNPLTGKVDYSLLKKITYVSQRFADNVIDHSYYFLPDNEKMATSERRIGKGVMGLSDLMIKLQLPYGSEEMLAETDEMFAKIKEWSYLASADIAAEKGSFAYYEEDQFLQSGFMQTMPEYVIDEIKEKGMRNVCSLTVAPTGSTGSMVGVSTGLEPYFSFKYFRSGRLGKFVEVNADIAEDYFKANPDETELPNYFVSAQDLSAMEHVKVQSVIQRHVDSAISKTCNAKSDFTVEDNKALYMEAWKSGCKGVTVYVDGSRDTQVLSVTAEENSFEAELEEEPVLVTSNGDEEIVDEDLTSDSRVCTIKFENGVMIKEC